MLSSFLKTSLVQNCHIQIKVFNKSNVFKCTQSVNQLKNLNTKSFSNYLKPRKTFQIEPYVKQNLNKCVKRSLFTTRKNEAIPPIIWLIVKPISKLSAVLFGRGFRKWWHALPKGKKEIIFNHLRRNKYRYSVGVGGSSLGVLVFYRTHLQQTPITGRTRFVLFNSAQLKEIEDMEKEILFGQYQKDLLGPNNPYTHRALTVANRLFDANKTIPEVSSVNWKLTVIKSDVKNAMAMPGGDVVVFTGLLDFVQNDDELSIILAHEMSHAILQHAAEEYSRDRMIDIFSIGLCLVIWSFLPSDILSLITQYVAEKLLSFKLNLPHSRLIETEADKVGLTLAARACFDVRYSSTFWNRMAKMEEDTELGNIPEMLSTHPASEKRALELEELMPAALQLRKDCKCQELPKDVILLKRISSEEALKLRNLNLKKV